MGHIDGREEVLSFFAHVEVALIGKLDQNVTAVARFTLPNGELYFDPIQVVWLGVLFGSADQVLLHMLANGVGELEMARGEIQMHSSRACSRRARRRYDSESAFEFAADGESDTAPSELRSATCVRHIANL